jgi:Fis family transcriptional regulator
MPLSTAVERALRAYLGDLQGQPTCDLYQQVLAEVEEPLLRVVMQEVDGNQCRAAGMLGLSRGTLRKKLKKHGLL